MSRCGEQVFTRGVHNLFFTFAFIFPHLFRRGSPSPPPIHQYNLIYLDAAHHTPAPQAQPMAMHHHLFLPLSANTNKHFEFY